MPASTNNMRTSPSYRALATALAGLPTLADKLDLLFRTVLVPVGDPDHAHDAAGAVDAEVERRLRQHTYKEVAAAIGSTPEYVGYLVKGERTNPAISYLRGLADFFGVGVALLVEQSTCLPDRPSVISTVGLGEVGYREVAAARVAGLFRLGIPAVSPAGATGETAVVEVDEHEVAAAAGCDVEEIRRLRKGWADELGVDTLRRVAKVFGVPVTYLIGVDDLLGQRVEQQLSMLRALRDADVLSVAMRMTGITRPDAVAELGAVVERLLALESTQADD